MCHVRLGATTMSMTCCLLFALFGLTAVDATAQTA
jgi:hypothetical protein